MKYLCYNFLNNVLEILTVVDLLTKYMCCLLFGYRKATKKHHTKNAMDRLVEDLIQESMSKGDFDNLSGSGKPLPQRVIYNPYEDFTTYKVLQPRWFELQW